MLSMPCQPSLEQRTRFSGLLRTAERLKVARRVWGLRFRVGVWGWGLGLGLRGESWASDSDLGYGRVCVCVWAGAGRGGGVTAPEIRATQ